MSRKGGRGGLETSQLEGSQARYIITEAHSRVVIGGTALENKDLYFCSSSDTSNESPSQIQDGIHANCQADPDSPYYSVVCIRSTLHHWLASSPTHGICLFPHLCWCNAHQPLPTPRCSSVVSRT